MKSSSENPKHGLPPGLPVNPDVRLPSELMYRIHALSRLISFFFDKLVEPHGITRAQWTTLMYIHHMPGATQTELADSMQMGRAAMGKMLDRLESKGLVERRADEADQRVRRVFPVSDAMELKKFMQQPEAALYAAFFGEMPREQMQDLNDALGTMHENGIAAMSRIEGQSRVVPVIQS